MKGGGERRREGEGGGEGEGERGRKRVESEIKGMGGTRFCVKAFIFNILIGAH